MGRPAPTFAIKTLGCRVNQADSDELLRSLLAAGFDHVNLDEPADAVIVNTCTVTHVADRKSRQAIARAMRNHPDARLFVTGCYAAVDPEAVKAAFPGAEVLGKVPPPKIAAAIADCLPAWSSQPALNRRTGFGEHARTRPSIKVQEGCRHGCAFCIVPRARGGPRSVAVPNVVSQVEALVDGGAREVVLTGIALGSYCCPQTGAGLGQLVETIADAAMPGRVRLSSIEPMDFDRRLVDLLAAGRICPHFHIPLQSGSAPTLTGMRRPYRPDDYAELIESLRAADPDVAIATDLMVGFPGESDQQHAESIAFCNRIRFAYMHVFPYSRRDHTLANRRSDHIAEAVKRSRLRSALELAASSAESYAADFVGRPAEVIWQRDSDGAISGITGNFLRVQALGCKPVPGTLARVLLTAAGDGKLAALPLPTAA